MHWGSPRLPTNRNRSTTARREFLEAVVLAPLDGHVRTSRSARATLMPHVRAHHHVCEWQVRVPLASPKDRAREAQGGFGADGTKAIAEPSKRRVFILFHVYTSAVATRFSVCRGLPVAPTRHSRAEFETVLGTHAHSAASNCGNVLLSQSLRIPQLTKCISR